MEIVQWQSCHEQRAFLHSHFFKSLWTGQGHCWSHIPPGSSTLPGNNVKNSFHANDLSCGSSLWCLRRTLIPNKVLKRGSCGGEAGDEGYLWSCLYFHVSSPDHNTALTQKQTLVEEYSKMQQKLYYRGRRLTFGKFWLSTGSIMGEGQSMGSPLTG